MVILRARVMRGGWAVPVSFVPITTLPMGWHWCDAVSDQHTLTDGGVVDWPVQAVLYHGWLEMSVLFPTLGGPTTATIYYARRLQRHPVYHRQVELPGLHIQCVPNWSSHPNIGPERKTVYTCTYEWHSITGQSTWVAPCPDCAYQLCLPTSLYLLFK